MELVRQRLLDEMQGPFPIVILEGVVGSGKRTLLRQWAARPDPGEVRLLISASRDETAVPSLAHQVISELADAGVPLPAELLQDDLHWPSDILSSMLVNAVADHTDRFRLGIIGIDTLAPSVLDAVMELQPYVSRWQLLFELFDAGPLVQRAAERQVAVKVIPEAELFFTGAEIDVLLAEHGPAQPTAVPTLLDLTHGYPFTVGRLIETHPQECLEGSVTVQMVRPDAWPHFAQPTAGFQFMANILPAPRLTTPEAVALGKSTSAPAYLHRLCQLNLGEMRFDPLLAANTFTWHEDRRAALIETVANSESPPTAWDDPNRLAAVALSHSDYELAVIALLHAGQLAAAEDIAGQWLWELTSIRRPAYWRGLDRLPGDRLSDWPALGLLRLFQSEQPSASTPRHRRGRTPRRVTEPQERLFHLGIASATEFWCHRFDQATEFALRWLSLADELEELLIATPSPATVSGCLLVAQTLIGADSFDEAVRVARLANRILDSSAEIPSEFSGRRFAATHMIEYLVKRQFGTLTSASAPPALDVEAGGSDFAVVLHAVPRIWNQLDEGEWAAAATRSRSALGEMREPTAWPLMLVTHCATLIATGDRAELVSLRHRLEQDTTWHHRRSAALRPDPTTDIVDAVLAAADDQEPAPTDRKDPGTGGSLNRLASLESIALAAPDVSPRQDQFSGFMAALQAIRRGDPPAAASFLQLTARRLFGFGPALATPTELDQLCLAWTDRGADPEAIARLRACRPFAGLLYHKHIAADLSERELQLLPLIRAGASNRRIAHTMGISVNTVKYHRAGLYRKLGATTGDEALDAARRLGL